MFPLKNIIRFKIMKILLIAIAFNCLAVSAFSQTTQTKTFEISSAEVLDFQFFECIDSILENYSNYKFDYYMITFMDSIDRQHCAILSPRMKGNIDIIDVSGINTLDHHVYTKFYSYVEFNDKKFIVSVAGYNCFIKQTGKKVNLTTRTMMPEDNIVPAWKFKYCNSRIEFNAFNDGLWGDKREDIIESFKDAVYELPDIK